MKNINNGDESLNWSALEKYWSKKDYRDEPLIDGLTQPIPKDQHKAFERINLELLNSKDNQKILNRFERLLENMLKSYSKDFKKEERIEIIEKIQAAIRKAYTDPKPGHIEEFNQCLMVLRKNLQLIETNEPSYPPAPSIIISETPEYITIPQLKSYIPLSDTGINKEINYLYGGWSKRAEDPITFLSTFIETNNFFERNIEGYSSRPPQKVIKEMLEIINAHTLRQKIIPEPLNKLKAVLEDFLVCMTVKETETSYDVPGLKINIPKSDDSFNNLFKDLHMNLLQADNSEVLKEMDNLMQEFIIGYTDAKTIKEKYDLISGIRSILSNSYPASIGSPEPIRLFKYTLTKMQSLLENANQLESQKCEEKNIHISDLDESFEIEIRERIEEAPHREISVRALEEQFGAFELDEIQRKNMMDFQFNPSGNSKDEYAHLEDKILSLLIPEIKDAESYKEKEKRLDKYLEKFNQVITFNAWQNSQVCSLLRGLLMRADTVLSELNED